MGKREGISGEPPGVEETLLQVKGGAERGSDYGVSSTARGAGAAREMQRNPAPRPPKTRRDNVIF